MKRPKERRRGVREEQAAVGRKEDSMYKGGREERKAPVARADNRAVTSGSSLARVTTREK